PRSGLPKRRGGYGGNRSRTRTASPCLDRVYLVHQDFDPGDRHHPRRDGDLFDLIAAPTVPQEIFRGAVEFRPARTSSSWRRNAAPSDTAMETPMKYMLLIYSNESEWQGLPKAEIDDRVAAYRGYTEALTQAGVVVALDRLQPATSATTVRVAGGKTNVLNGPYAESPDHLGCFYM